MSHKRDVEESCIKGVFVVNDVNWLRIHNLLVSNTKVSGPIVGISNFTDNFDRWIGKEIV